MQPIDLGRFISPMIDFSRLRSATELILRLIPPPCELLGISTQYRPARRQIGGERRALVAALFLDHLDQQHLTPLDNVLNLVTPAQRHALGAQFVRFLRLAAPTLAPAHDRPDPRPSSESDPVIVAIRLVPGAAVPILGFMPVSIAVAVRRLAAIDRGDVVLFGRVDLGDAAAPDVSRILERRRPSIVADHCRPSFPMCRSSITPPEWSSSSSSCVIVVMR